MFTLSICWLTITNVCLLLICFFLHIIFAHKQSHSAMSNLQTANLHVGPTAKQHFKTWRVFGTVSGWSEPADSRTYIMYIAEIYWAVPVLEYKATNSTWLWTNCAQPVPTHRPHSNHSNMANNKTITVHCIHRNERVKIIQAGLGGNVSSKLTLSSVLTDGTETFP